MKSYAIISAAGPVIPDSRIGRQFSRPRPLLSLGKETVIERLIRQAKRAGLEVLIGIGKIGIGGWTVDYLGEFKNLGCKCLQSDSLGARELVGTILFLLGRLLKEPGLEDSSTVYILPGDWVFSDELFQELLTYRVPCIYEFKERDWGFSLAGRDIVSVAEFLRRWERPYGYSQLWQDIACGGAGDLLKRWGFEIRRNRSGDSERFVEIDWLEEYEDALRLAKSGR